MKFLIFILFLLSVISLYALEEPKDTDRDGKINISKLDHLKLNCTPKVRQKTFGVFYVN